MDEGAVIIFDGKFYVFYIFVMVSCLISFEFD